METPDSKKCHQYFLDNFMLGFVASPSNETLPLCLLCEITLCNDAMKPYKLEDHLHRMNADKKHKRIEYFKIIKENLRKKTNEDVLCKKKSAPSSIKNGVMASYNISFLAAEKGQSHTIGEELIIPSVRGVIEKVMKEDSSSVLKCLSLSNGTVQRHIGEMALDVGKPFISELRGCKFAILLDESTFSTDNTPLTYVGFCCASMKCIVDEFLFAKYLRLVSKGKTIFKTLQGCFEFHDIPLENIAAVAYDGAPAMIGRYRGFSAFLREIVPEVMTGHCVMDR